MKTLEEIKDEYSREIRFDDWHELIYSHESYEIEHHWIIVTKRYAIEVAKEALRNAAENSTVTAIQREGFCDYIADTESILSETNIPKL